MNTPSCAASGESSLSLQQIVAKSRLSLSKVVRNRNWMTAVLDLGKREAKAPVSLPILLINDMRVSLQLDIEQTSFRLARGPPTAVNTRQLLRISASQTPHRSTSSSTLPLCYAPFHWRIYVRHSAEGVRASIGTLFFQRPAPIHERPIYTENAAYSARHCGRPAPEKDARAQFTGGSRQRRSLCI